MPITVTAPQGVLTETGEREILPRLTAALIEVSGLTGNAFLAPIVGGTVQVLPAARVYAGGVNRPVVMIELKLPGVLLPDAATRAAFVKEATAIAEELTVPGHAVADIWINVLHASDGGWGIGGLAYTDADLLEGVRAAV
ncbi:hypothetical protein [Streptomyces sp. NPDC047928]|uniref:hypothetical protein n=1 Tax=unclassified Streptomyces TaxID=2593676 RepID=UPI00371D0F0B